METIETQAPLLSATKARATTLTKQAPNSDSEESCEEASLAGKRGPMSIQSLSSAPRVNRTSKNSAEEQEEDEEGDRSSTTGERPAAWTKRVQPNGKVKARVRLETASRAIFLLRRAATQLVGGRITGNSPNGSTANGGTLARQNTTDSCQSQASAGQASFANSNETIPQFLVPKLNTLKLPIVCLIKSFDGELMREVFVHRYELGQYLIESLKVSLGIDDSKYLGLRMAKSLEEQEDLRNPWLDLNESVCKQIKSYSNSTQAATIGSTRSIDFYLRIKFYPPNLARVQDPFLRNYLWLQLRRDLRLGKLTSSMNNLTLLMACVLQHELGDFKQNLIERIPELNILPNQDLIEEQAIIMWRKRLSGTIKHQAQMQFLRAAVILETYGFDYYPVRDHQRQRAYLLGFNYAGIKTIRNGRIVHHFRWHSLSKISYERRMIIFHIYPTENSKKQRKQIIGFKCLSNEDCQNLYIRLLEQKYFFTVDLAYFDKSVRRPSCLYNSFSATDDWMAGVDRPTESENHGHQLHWDPASSFDSRTNSRVSESDQPCNNLRLAGHFDEIASGCSDSSVNCTNMELTLDGSKRPFHCSNGTPELCPTQESLDNCNQSAFVCSRPAAARKDETVDGISRSQRPSSTHRLQRQQSMVPTRDDSLDQLDTQEAMPCVELDLNGSWNKLLSCQTRLGEHILPLIGPHDYRRVGQNGFSLFVCSALKFCALIFVANFLLRLTDGVSNSIIDLLTIESQTGAAKDELIVENQ